MTLLQIKYFLNIAECGSFTKTAERFFISQPAVSNQLSLLEEELGVRLFNRTKKEVVLTPAGRLWKDFFLEFTTRGISVQRQARLLSASSKNMISLGIQEHQCIQEVFDAIALYHTKNPEWQVSVNVLSPADYYSRIDMDQFNMLIAPESILANFENLNIVHRFNVSRVIIMSSHHPRAGIENLTYRDLLDEVWLLPEQSSTDREWNERKLEEVFSSRGLSVPNHTSIPTIDTLLAAVRAGIGITVVPKSLISDSAAGFFLVDTGETETVVVATTNTSNKEVQNFLSVLLKTLPCQ